MTAHTPLKSHTEKEKHNGKALVWLVEVFELSNEVLFDLLSLKNCLTSGIIQASERIICSENIPFINLKRTFSKSK